MSRRFPSAVVDQLLQEGKLEKVVADRDQADEFLADARSHVESVQALLAADSNDLTGMMPLTYDAAIKPLRAVLVNQGLRSKSGEGGHPATVDAVAGQLEKSGLPVTQVRWMLRQRNDGEYGNQALEPVDREAIEEGLVLAVELIDGAERVLDVMRPY